MCIRYRVWDILILAAGTGLAVETNAAPSPTPASAPSRTVVDLSAEVTSQPSLQATTETAAARELDVAANVEVRTIEADLHARVDKIQQALEREEQNLNRQLSALQARRSKALSDGNQPALQQVEIQEKQLIQGYEMRIQQLLNSMPAETTAPSTLPQKATHIPQPPVAPPIPKVQPRKQSKATYRDQDRKPTKNPRATPENRSEKEQKRRFRLWPFR